VFEVDHHIQGRLVELRLDDLSPGDVVIRAAYSSVNYKDALAATGTGKIMRRFPLVGGGRRRRYRRIERRPAFQTWRSGARDRVRPGGQSRRRLFPVCAGTGRMVVPLPPGLSALDAMTIGTAGFTAALSIVEMERNGLVAGHGPVIVTGATGGVGSMGVACLVSRGYQVTALTGKDGEHEYLRGLGAQTVVSRHTLQMGTRPLEKSMWAGAIESGRRSDSGVAHPHDDVRRLHRAVRTDRWRRVPDDGSCRLFCAE